MYRTLYSPQGGRIILDGREVINMASNNYLGLANHPAVVAAAKEALEKYGVATTASRNICGNYPVHDELEEKLAKFKGVEATLVFNCGVTANSGLIPQLVGKGDFIYSDELNHGSIIDGCRLSGAKIKVFRHMDMAHLEELLQEPVEGKRLIITDGVFSMDGDLAPLPEMADLADQYNALLVVDDAHGDGVMGPAGRGTVDHFGLRDRIIIETGSLSKAFGSAGGFVAGPKEFIEALRPKARSFIFTASPMAPCLTAAAAKAVDLVMENTALVAFAAGGIAVDTRNGDTREQRRERLFKLFGAQPHGDQVRGTARRALARHRTLTVAMVAAQMLLRLMQRVVVIATWAFGYPTTVVAQ